MYHSSFGNLPFYLPSFLLFITITLLISPGCSEVSEFEKQQAWLEKNYPSRKKNLKKLNYPSIFEKEILNGQAVVGMRWQEVLIAKLITPYGPKAGQAFYWQGKQLVAKCAAQCKALLVTKDTLYFFESDLDELQLVLVTAKRNWPIHYNYVPESYEQARALFGQKR